MKLWIFVFVLILLICCPVVNCESDGPFIVPAISPTLPIPTSTPSPTPVVYDYLIVIDKELNFLTVYNYREVAGIYPVATGKKGKETPSGKFLILKKIIDPYWGGGGYATPISGGNPNNPLGHYWLGLSITRSGSDYGIHGNTDSSSIGTNASRGCIRMHNSDIPVLFNLVLIGTRVWIGTTEEVTLWINEYTSKF